MSDEQEWLAVIIAKDGRRQYLASASVRVNQGRPFTTWRSNAARFETENGALFAGHTMKEDYDRRPALRDHWIADVEAERVK